MVAYPTGRPTGGKMRLREHDIRDKELLDKTVVQGNTEFALDLYGQLREAEGNLFFSPYSISTALAITYAGARRNTELQMAQMKSEK